jgi:hypothetical protein
MICHLASLWQLVLSRVNVTKPKTGDGGFGMSK